METTQKEQAAVMNTRRDIHQQVTDTIIQQLEAGTVPWHKPWKGDDNRLFSIPKKSHNRQQIFGHQYSPALEFRNR